jgi:hypothetical protein
MRDANQREMEHLFLRIATGPRSAAAGKFGKDWGNHWRIGAFYLRAKS